MDGVAASSDPRRVVVLCATNRPEELDQALLRRLPKRVYVPLPDAAARAALVGRLLSADPAGCGLSAADLDRVVASTRGYSGSDLHALCREAALAPLRELGPTRLAVVSARSLRLLRVGDFAEAQRAIRPSVDPQSLGSIEAWDRQFGAAHG